MPDVQDEQCSATATLIARIAVLQRARGWSQAELARRLHERNAAWIQTRLNKMMNEHQRFTVTDLDDLAAVFEITVAELFFDRYGQWNRRSKSDRRKGERRQADQAIYDPTTEPADPMVSRLAFPRDDGGK